MKLFVLAALVSAPAFAQTWTETFKLPEGTTYRARMAGFDCGTYGEAYVAATSDIRTLGVQFRQFSADKDLNKVIIEATYPGTDGSNCIYGAFLTRQRESQTVDLTHSEIVGDAALCADGQASLDRLFTKSRYEGSRRGLRYIAVEVLTPEVAEVCASGTMRAVFDRRFTE